MNKFHVFRSQASWGFVLALLLAVHRPAFAVELEDQTLMYEVTYITQHAGELEIQIRRENNQVKTTAISHLSDLAKMFLSGLTAETWFSIEGDSLRLERGHILSHDHSSVKSSFEIDRGQASLVFVPSKPAEVVKSTDVFESTSFPLVLVSSDIPGIAGQQIREITPPHPPLPAPVRRSSPLPRRRPVIRRSP